LVDKAGIKVEFIDPGQPGQNAGHEQMHRVYKAEALQPPAHTLRGQMQRTQRWRKIYNHQRPHESLNMRFPAELYRPSKRRMPKVLRPWQYNPAWETRLVKGKGMISLYGLVRYVGEAFERERVGLERDKDRWNVYFGPHLIGYLIAHASDGIHACWLRSRAPRQQSTHLAG
jgi:Integrase core domain